MPGEEEANTQGRDSPPQRSPVASREVSRRTEEKFQPLLFQLRHPVRHEVQWRLRSFRCHLYHETLPILRNVVQATHRRDICPEQQFWCSHLQFVPGLSDLRCVQVPTYR